MVDEIKNLRSTDLTFLWSAFTPRDCHQHEMKALHITITHVT
jgi:hypothetical protein